MKHMNYKFGTREKGLSIIGVLFALVIGLIVLSVVATQFSKAQASSNAQSEIQNVLALKAATKEIYKSPMYTGLTTTTMTDSKKAPPKMINGDQLVNVWAGAVVMAPATPADGAVDSNFTISEAGVPTDECNTLASGLADNFTKVVIGTETVKDASAGTSGEYSETATVAACKAGNITLDFTSA